MSVQPVQNAPPQRSIVYRVLRTALVTILVLFLPMFMLVGIGSGAVELIFTVAFGWWMFLERTVPEIVWNWSLVGMAVVSSLFIMALSHWFLRWLSKEQIALSQWPIKWTICGLVAVSLVFLVGMSVGGIAHQVGWMAASEEPLFQRKYRRIYDVSNMKQLELALRMASEDERGNLDKIRQALWKNPNNFFGQSRTFPPFLQAYHVLIVTSPDGLFDGAIIFPRNGASLKQVGASVSIGENDLNFIPAAKLNEVLEKYKNRLQAL